MPTQVTIVDPQCQQRLSAILGLYALIAGVFSFSGWAFDFPRLTDWFNDGISIQPNATVLITLAGAAVLLLQYGYDRLALAFGGLVAVVGGLNLLQYVTDTDLGFNHQLLFGRDWGRGPP